MTCPSSPPVTTVQPSLDTSMHRMAPVKVRMKTTTVLSYEKSFSKQRSSYNKLATFDIPKQLTRSLLDNTITERLFYSQGRSNVPPKIALMNLLFEGWIRWLLKISVSSLDPYVCNEWIYTRGSHEISGGSVFLNFFNLTEYRGVIEKN